MAVPYPVWNPRQRDLHNAPKPGCIISMIHTVLQNVPPMIVSVLV